jgi:hypothetical protein
MQLSSSVQKVNLATVEPVGSPLSAGTQIYFTTKITIDGNVYLRTKHDTEGRIDEGILLSSLQEIPENYVAMSRPDWYETKTALTKVDPVTAQPVGGKIAAGIKIYFPTKFDIGGETFLRTQHDTTSNVGSAIALSELEHTTLDYAPLVTPRWIQAKNNTANLDLITGATVSTVSKGTQQYYGYKLDLNGNIYLDTSLPASGTYSGIPMSDLVEIPANYTSMTKPRWMQLVNNTSKQNPVTEAQVGAPLSAGTQIYFTSKITVGGVNYLQTRHDADGHISAGIPMNDIQDITLNFISMTQPRYMKTRSNTYKKDPITSKNVGGLINKGTKISFSSKVMVGGVLFLRTQHDTNLGYSTVIEYSDLE